MFRSKFDSWPQTTDVAVSEDGRGKVAGQSLNSFASDFYLYLFFLAAYFVLVILTITLIKKKQNLTSVVSHCFCSTPQASRG